MNAEEMIENVLCRMDRERLEQAALGDQAQLIRLDRLRVAIDRLVDDGSCYEHPPDLASRTVSFVARNRRRPLTLLEHVATRLPFRWADFAVAASIFVAGVLTLLPAIQRSRERMNQAGCVFNLQQLGNSLAQYATLQASLPYPPSHRSDTHAGMFAVMLHDAGLLKDLSVLDCPCNGPCPRVQAGACRVRPGRSHTTNRSRALPTDVVLGLRLQRRLSTAHRSAGAARSHAFGEHARAGRFARSPRLCHDPRRQQPEPRPPRPERLVLRQ